MNVLDVQAWVQYASGSAEGRYISNIYYDRKEDFLFIKLKGGLIILAEPGRRVHFTTRRSPPSDFKPDPLVVLARKYMRNRKLADIQMIGGDRIVSFTADNDYKLIVELVPRGVIVLTGPEDIILAASKYASLRDRVIKPKRPYSPPPSRGKALEEIEAGDIVEAVDKRGRLVPALVSILGVPGELAEEAVHRAGLDPSIERIGFEDAESILLSLNEIIREARGGKGYIVTRGEEGLEADPFYPSRFIGTAEIKGYEVFNNALEEYFELYSSTKPATRGEGPDSEKGRLVASLEKAREQAALYRSEAVLLRQIADLISRNYEVFQEFLECIRIKGRECLDIYNVQGELASGKLIVLVNGHRITIPLNVRNVNELVVELFKRAGTLEAKAERAEKTRIEIEEKLKELTIKARSREISELYRRRKRYWFERFHYTVTRKGFLTVGGKDASQNQLLVRRYLEEGDIFMHADIHGAPAVLVKTKGRAIGEDDLYDAAVIAVAYSKGWRSGIGSIRVFYVDASQVSLSPPTGEYLAKGGIMVYGRKNYLRPVPVRIWIGIGLDGDRIPRILQGSREVVEHYSLVYASLVPGDGKRIDVARQIKKKFMDIVGSSEKQYIMAIPEQDLASRIPGRATITGVKKGKGELLDLSGII